MFIHRTRRRARAAALLAIATTVLASLAACSSDDDGGGDSDAKSITVWIEEDLPDRVAATQTIVDAFTAKTGVKVKLVAAVPAVVVGAAGGQRGQHGGGGREESGGPSAASGAVSGHGASGVSGALLSRHWTYVTQLSSIWCPVVTHRPMLQPCPPAPATSSS